MFKKNRKVIIYIFFILAILLISPSLQSSLNSNLEKKSEEKFQETKEFFLTETEGGKTKWDIKALSAEFSSEGQVFLNQVKINFYENGERLLNIKADKGRIDNATKNVHLEGNVIGITNRGESFVTQYLDWIQAEKNIVTEDRIKVTGQNIVITAKGLHFDTALKKIVLKKNVRAEIYGGNEAFPFRFGK